MIIQSYNFILSDYRSHNVSTQIYQSWQQIIKNSELGENKTGRAQGFSTEQSLIKTLIEETLALETKKNLYSWIKVERVAYRNT